MQNPILTSRAKNLAGLKFSRLTVLRYAGKTIHGKSSWICRCDCGAEKEVSGNSLTSGKTKSCGCLPRDRMKIIGESLCSNLVGTRFGRLVVVEKCDTKRLGGRVQWKCRCDCGNIKTLSTSVLTSGQSKSCGCFRKDLHTTHGMTGTTEYNTMRARAYKERSRALDSGWTMEMEMALNRFYDRCVICGGTYLLATDHVYPLSAGYGLFPGNAIKLCKSCNSSKGSKMPEDLPEEIMRVVLRSADNFLRHWESMSSEARIDNVV